MGNNQNNKGLVVLPSGGWFAFTGNGLNREHTTAQVGVDAVGLHSLWVRTKQRSSHLACMEVGLESWLGMHSRDLLNRLAIFADWSRGAPATAWRSFAAPNEIVGLAVELSDAYTCGLAVTPLCAGPGRHECSDDAQPIDDVRLDRWSSWLDARSARVDVVAAFGQIARLR